MIDPEAVLWFNTILLCFILCVVLAILAHIVLLLHDFLVPLLPLLQKIVGQLNSEALSFGIVLANKDGSDAVQGDSPMAVQLPDDTGSKILTLTPKDKKGVPTVLDGPATFVSTDPLVAAVTQQGDLACRIDFIDTSRPVQIQFSGDARMGPDVVPVTGTLDITFVAGEAATLDFTLADAPPPAQPAQ